MRQLHAERCCVVEARFRALKNPKTYKTRRRNKVFLCYTFSNVVKYNRFEHNRKSVLYSFFTTIYCCLTIISYTVWTESAYTNIQQLKWYLIRNCFLLNIMLPILLSNKRKIKRNSCGENELKTPKLNLNLYIIYKRNIISDSFLIYFCMAFMPNKWQCGQMLLPSWFVICSNDKNTS